MQPKTEHAKGAGVNNKWDHLSLCVLDVFFENESENKQSVKPLIQRYIDYASVQTAQTLENAEDWREHTNSQLLQTIFEMDAQKRQAVFNQKNLSSLTVFVEMFVASGIETLEDLQEIAADDLKVLIFKKVMEKKGYVNKFVDLTIKELFGKEYKMKRKDNQPQSAPNAQKPALGTVKNAAPTEFRTKSRNVQLFPAAKGAHSAAILFVISACFTLGSFLVGIAKLGNYDPSTAFNCKNLADQIAANQSQAALMQAQGIQQQAQDYSAYDTICNANAASQTIGYVLLVLAVFALALTAFSAIRFLKITLHNSFARTHNLFEMSHRSFEN